MKSQGGLEKRLRYRLGEAAEIPAQGRYDIIKTEVDMTTSPLLKKPRRARKPSPIFFATLAY